MAKTKTNGEARASLGPKDSKRYARGACSSSWLTPLMLRESAVVSLGHSLSTTNKEHSCIWYVSGGEERRAPACGNGSSRKTSSVGAVVVQSLLGRRLVVAMSVSCIACCCSGGQGEGRRVMPRRQEEAEKLHQDGVRASADGSVVGGPRLLVVVFFRTRCHYRGGQAVPFTASLRMRSMADGRTGRGVFEGEGGKSRNEIKSLLLSVVGARD